MENAAMSELLSSLFDLSAESDKRPIEFPGRRRRSAGPQPTRTKVLVVDDEKLIVDTIVEILTAAGFDVVGSADGWAALDAAARFHPDYLLSDVLMPKMNGVELAIAMRKMYPSIKILLFTGQAGISRLLLEGQQQGYEFELIAKPIHPLKLIERLQQE
jgi:CheY-like chemotaxis protein